MSKLVFGMVLIAGAFYAAYKLGEKAGMRKNADDDFDDIADMFVEEEECSEEESCEDKPGEDKACEGETNEDTNADVVAQ